MKIDNALVRRFLKNQSTKEEAELVWEYFNKHTDELEKYIPSKDWLLVENKERLDPATSKKMLEHMREKYDNKKSVSIISSLIWYAVAACMAGMMVLEGIKLLTRVEKGVNKKAIAIIENSGNKDSVQALLKTIKNKAGRVMQIALPDGSAVTIYPGSSLQYLPAFEKDKRELYLDGKALFVVSKDPSRPFTVHAMSIATTALGTLFEVNTRIGNNIRIRLFEGKVVIRPEKYSGPGDNKKVYLTAGQQLEIATGFMYRVSNIPDNVSKFLNKVDLHKPNARKEKPGNELSFRNTPLLTVFDSLGEKFNVHFTYPDKEHFPLLPFTGQFNERDSMKDILSILCKLNNLQYKVEGDKVTISFQ